MKSSLFAPAWRSFLYSVAACVMAGLVSLGCSDEPAGSASAGPKTYPYQVTATVGMVADIVRNVAGDKANVTGIMGTGVDPHLYKPTRDDVSSMTRADVVFYAGLLLEGKMSDTLIKVARGKPVYAVTELIDEKFLLEPPEFARHFDPHVWMDASAWGKCVEEVAKSLGEFDPKNADLYRANAATYVEQCTKLYEYGKKSIGSIPEGNRTLITSHDAFNYFGRAYGLNVMGVQGLSTESEAGLQRGGRRVRRGFRSHGDCRP